MRRTLFAVLAGFAALVGCRSAPVEQAEAPARTVVVEAGGSPSESGSPAAASPTSPGGPGESAPPGGTGATGEPDVLGSREPCAARLHDVAGTMLLYYAMHKRLPAGLDELRALADIDQELDFTCPTSGRPYVYVPSGLSYPGKEERLVLHDADAAHAGARWGILAVPPKGARPAAMWAVRLPEAVFNAYSAPAP